MVDLFGGIGTGPLWGMASRDLNATLLAWPPGHELVADTNSELDVLLIVVESALLVEKGSSGAIRAGADGVRYVSVHRRRGPLQITETPERR